MNAHNEQHDPACIAAYEQLFQADSRDPSQTERLAVWARSWNAARAAWSSPVVKQNLTTQPAAAQEAVAEVVDIIGRSGVEIHWLAGPAKIGDLLYAAPVTAAPAVTDPVAAYERELAAGATHEHALHAICTPAAPGIDLAGKSGLLRRARSLFDQDREYALERGDSHHAGKCTKDIAGIDALIDASSKGGSGPLRPALVDAAALRRALAEYPGRNTHQLQARKVCAGVLALAESYGAEARNSPKDGSDTARLDSGMIRLSHCDEFGEDGHILYIGVNLRAAIDAAMQAQAGDAEVQP